MNLRRSPREKRRRRRAVDAIEQSAAWIHYYRNPFSSRKGESQGRPCPKFDWCSPHNGFRIVGAAFGYGVDPR